jgi:hypothetical protein
MIEGMQATGRRNPSLSHGTRKDVLIPPGLFDERLAASQDSTDRRTQALGEIDPDTVNLRCICSRRDPRCHARIEQSSAVHVYRQATGTGVRAD